MLRQLAVLLVVATTAFAQEAQNNAPAAEVPADASARVTLGLGDYERLRRAGERPSATVVDTIQLSGTFREKDLLVTFSGRSVGTRPQVPALDNTNDVILSGCEGSAIVTRSAKGAFDVIPLADAFSVRCSLRLSGSDRLQMHVLQNVLAVRSTVADGELVVGDEDPVGGRNYSLVRQVAGPGQTLAATATGRYLITLLPDATRFRYTIEVHNPNRSTSTLAMQFASAEHLQQIDSSVPYDVEGGRYVFSIPPGDSTIAMNGELRGTSWRAPVAATLQYVVIESHPLLRPNVKTPARRVSVAETGITTQYRGALAFETGNGTIGWEVKRLAALSTTSYALSQATHQLFVPSDGEVLGETTFQVRNEGAAELLLPTMPQPTFLSLNDEPLLMTLDANKRVSVPLSVGEQTLLVQHRQPFSRFAGFGYGRLHVPRLGVPASETHVETRFPEKWIPLFTSFATRTSFTIPSIFDVLGFLLLMFWIERVLAWLGMLSPRRFVVAAAAALAALLVNTFLWLVLLLFGAVTLVWGLIHLQRASTAVKVFAGCAAGVALLIALGSTMIVPRGEEYDGIAGLASETVMTDTAGKSSNIGISAPALSKGVNVNVVRADYQGLPARFTLPPGERRVFFNGQLLSVERPQTVFVILMSVAILKTIGALLALIALYALFHDRALLLGNLRAHLARLQSGVPSEEVAPA